MNNPLTSWNRIASERLGPTSWQLTGLVYKSLPGVLKVAAKYPITIIKAGQEAGEWISGLVPAKLELPYQIPEYSENMALRTPGEKFIRPTYHCQSDAPEIIALANKLGVTQKSSIEYAQACFDFIKNNLQFSVLLPPSGAVKTLHLGKGLCLDITTLFIALCRAGGIPARYKIYREAFLTPAYDIFTSGNAILKEWYDSIGYLILHISSEIFIDGIWLNAALLPSDLAAGMGIPLSYLGDSSSGTWGFRIRESIIRTESIPPRVVIAIGLAIRIFAGLLIFVEMNIQQKVAAGKKLLQELGEEHYTRQVKKNYRAMLPEISQKLYQALEIAEG